MAWQEGKGYTRSGRLKKDNVKIYGRIADVKTAGLRNNSEINLKLTYFSEKESIPPSSSSTDPVKVKFRVKMEADIEGEIRSETLKYGIRTVFLRIKKYPMFKAL